MLTICSSTTELDFTTTGAVMMELFKSTTTANVDSTQQITYLGTLIRRASAWAERYVQRPLGLQVYSETLPAAGDNVLMLSRRPVVAVLRMFDATATGSATEFCSTDYRVEDAEAGFLGRDAGFAWTAQRAYSAGDFNLGLTSAVLPGRVERPWLVEYAAGYVPIGGVTTSSENWSTAGPNGATTTGRTLPDDVEQAVILKVKEWWEGVSGVESERVGDLAVSYARGEGPSPAEALLAPYRSLL